MKFTPTKIGEPPKPKASGTDGHVKVKASRKSSK
jgi:hypothetical protein